MITVQGSLSVTFKGNSDANEKSAVLKCSLGLFNVKYSYLHLLEVSIHQGYFVITQVRPVCCNNDGKYYLELEADISDIAYSLDSEELSFLDQKVSESLKKDSSKNTDALADNKNTLLAPETIDDTELFGSLWPLGNTVQLDVTLGRDHLRAQCN